MTDDDQRHEPLQMLLDVVFYAPVGAFFHGPALISEAAEKGRSQVANAKVLGAVALERGLRDFGQVAESVQGHVGEILVAAARAAGAPMAGAESAGPASDAEPVPGGSGADQRSDGPTLRVVPDSEAKPVGDLPIPDYDNLSASQVVPRLDDLADDELEAVRNYEAAHRGRMTILSRIAQLQAS